MEDSFFLILTFCRVVLNIFVARTVNVEIDCKIKFKLSLLQTKIYTYREMFLKDI